MQESLIMNIHTFILFVQKQLSSTSIQTKRLYHSFVRASCRRLHLFQQLLEGTSIYIITFQHKKEEEKLKFLSSEKHWRTKLEVLRKE